MASKKNKTTSQKALEKQAAAQAKQAELMRKKQRAERLKKAGIVIVCVILVLALCIPTVALSFLSQ